MRLAAAASGSSLVLTGATMIGTAQDVAAQESNDYARLAEPGTMFVAGLALFALAFVARQLARRHGSGSASR